MKKYKMVLMLVVGMMMGVVITKVAGRVAAEDLANFLCVGIKSGLSRVIKVGDICRSYEITVPLSGSVVTGGYKSDLSGADLSRKDMDYHNLAGVNFSGATFDGSTLKYANLNGADFTEAIIISTDLTGATNMSEEKLLGVTWTVGDDRLETTCPDGTLLLDERVPEEEWEDTCIGHLVPSVN